MTHDEAMERARKWLSENGIGRIFDIELRGRVPDPFFVESLAREFERVALQAQLDFAHYFDDQIWKVRDSINSKLDALTPSQTPTEKAGEKESV